MKVISEKNESKRVGIVKRLIESAGNKIGNVHFIKRSDGSRRRMSYRLHVSKPTYAPVPKGDKGDKGDKGGRVKKTDYRTKIVFDTNKLRYNKKGGLIGRGDYRSIPLENVIRVSVNGTIYKIMA
jgi:hypothetical protein